MRGRTIEILKQAMEGNFAVGAFNVSNMELTQGVVRAAAKLHTPCIVQVTINAMNYAGDKILGGVVGSVVEYETNHFPVGFHLDHGHSLEDIERAIEMGADSVMIDASKFDLKENIKLTKKIVEFAHSKNVSVQAELGRVPYLGQEEMEVNWDELMTKPEEAKILVEETGIDALAVGIGNAHGFFRERSVPDWDRLDQIKQLVPKTPLIMHGASDWDNDKVKKAVAGGICCFNIDTDIRIAFSTAICKFVSGRCDVSDPRKMLGAARDKVIEKVTEKMKMFSGRS